MPRELERDRLYVTVDLLILTVRGGRLNLLLSRRTAQPFEGRWALPGAFVGLEESAEEAARRLLREMLPDTEGYLEQLFTFTDADRDPRGRVISVACLGIVPWRRLEARLIPEATSLRPFALTLRGEEPRLTGEAGEDLAAGDLAFDHRTIIAAGLRRLRGKIDYSDLGFRFLGDRAAFSLGELQTVHEAVLDTRLDASNFRRDILRHWERAGRLAPTAGEARNGRGRPAALYRFE